MDDIINISNISLWLYCPRKLYLIKVKGIRQPPNRSMVIGRINHAILENFSKNEKFFVKGIFKNYETPDLVFMYKDYLKKIVDKVFLENLAIINKFKIDKKNLFKKIFSNFSEDLKLRIKSIKRGLSKGYFGKDLWENLDSVYLSEIPVESKVLKLRGRVDRIELQRSTNNVIPYEIKSRADRVFSSDELQLTAYAMLLEEKYKMQIKKGVIELENKKQELDITEKNKSRVLWIANKIRKMKDNPAPKMQSNFNKCSQCDLREQCIIL